MEIQVEILFSVVINYDIIYPLSGVPKIIQDIYLYGRTRELYGKYKDLLSATPKLIKV